MSFHIAQCHLLPLLQSSHSNQIDVLFVKLTVLFINMRTLKLKSQVKKVKKLKKKQQQLKSIANNAHPIPGATGAATSEKNTCPSRNTRYKTKSKS